MIIYIFPVLAILFYIFVKIKTKLKATRKGKIKAGKVFLADNIRNSSNKTKR